MADTVNFTVTGETTIHCAGCEQRIRRALRRVPGVQKVQTSISRQEVAVTFEAAQVSPGQIQTRLGEIRYEVTQEGSPQ